MPQRIVGAAMRRGLAFDGLPVPALDGINQAHGAAVRQEFANLLLIEHGEDQFLYNQTVTILIVRVPR